MFHAVAKISYARKNNMTGGKDFVFIPGNHRSIPDAEQCFFHTFDISCIIIDNCCHGYILLCSYPNALLRYKMICFEPFRP